MYLDEAAEIFTFWERNPPEYQTIAIIARMLGWTPAERPSDAAEQLLAASPPGMAIQHVPSGIPAPLDIDAMRARNRARIAERAERNRTA